MTSISRRLEGLVMAALRASAAAWSARNGALRAAGGGCLAWGCLAWADSAIASAALASESGCGCCCSCYGCGYAKAAGARRSRGAQKMGERAAGRLPYGVSCSGEAVQMNREILAGERIDGVAPPRTWVWAAHIFANRSAASPLRRRAHSGASAGPSPSSCS
eukprot:366085-Chlamydomonas_euryale.AAC.10